ncbi:sialidase family protein [Mesobacillus zeae]|uniref:Exo-alpha-sialidase n=1 Tax=Mesobacillus zeae TaxID=1917180 RepID=A0A398BDV4_9BACI|nr:sialidase family protein [Mesobacillus zeae]RID85753.1 exo-alpha-sialidase [Mesobacillus zeae]
MEKFVIGIAAVMLVCLIAGMFVYQEIPKATVPPFVSESEQLQKQQQDSRYADETIDYSLQNDELSITYNKGKDWIGVPVEKEELFAGDYSGNQEELIRQSYILTKERAAFLYWKGSGEVTLSISRDNGQTWQHVTVTQQYPSIRFRKVAFLNDRFGYVILSGDRTMSQEMSNVYLTNDGGKSWGETGSSNVTRLISDGGFVDENTGFLSFGIINPEEPQLYTTQDAGATWNESRIEIPAEYHKIFAIAEMPVKEGDNLMMLVNQGPNGDYKGGKVKGKFRSKDQGLTWEFVAEVESNDTE